jgi:dihydrolipoamide dehydrogenase
MDSYDVAVIGGGPAGYSAALKAAELGARVALIESEKLGGACVHHACIPTNILLDAAHTFVAARELAVMGVFAVGEEFNFARAAARKNALVQKLADGIATALRMRKVTVIPGRASFADAHTLDVSGRDPVWAEAIVIATGTRWEPRPIPGLPADRLLTADAAQALVQVPAHAAVLGGGPASTAFALEYATLLAIAGSEVTLITPASRLLSGLDVDLGDIACATMTDLGVTVLDGATIDRADGENLHATSSAGPRSVRADMVIAADPRRPFFESLNLPASGVITSDHLPVDRSCRTNLPHIFAAGDVTGGLMLTNAASHMGEVAATNAVGGEAITRLSQVPHVLHTIPEIGWVGLTEEQALSQGYAVTTGIVDLSFNARAIARGARGGVLKLVADAELGGILGVHVVGPDAAEVIALAATLMQTEATLHDVAALTLWHPSVAESLAEAARRAVAASPPS